MPTDDPRPLDDGATPTLAHDEPNLDATPDIEMIEEADAIFLCCDVPGIEREDIRVDVSPQRVVITTINRALEGLRGIFRRDRPDSGFERAITLPREVRPDVAEAHYNNGVLEIVLPKKARGGSGVYRVPAE